MGSSGTPHRPGNLDPAEVARLSRRGFLGLSVGAGAVAALAACGVSSDNSAGSGGGSGGSGQQRLFMTPKWTGFPYFEQARAGGEEAAGELKDKFTYSGADHADVSLQTQTLQNFLTQQPNAIILAAIDGDAVAPSLKTARSKGIKVVTFDADAAVDARDIFCNQLSYKLAATTMLDCALQNDPSGGKVAFVAASPTAPNHTAHIKFMREAIASDPKYSKLTALPQVQYAADDDAKSYSIAVSLMQANPDPKYIISSSAVSVPSAARAISATKKSGKVYATGFALPSSMKQFVKEGSNKAFALWDPKELGYMATYAAHQLLTGELKTAEGSTFTAGKAGTFKVLADGEIDYDKPIIFTPKNIDQYSF
jgi:rhamnose transport system substrate-binding protein